MEKTTPSYHLDKKTPKITFSAKIFSISTKTYQQFFIRKHTAGCLIDRGNLEVVNHLLILRFAKLLEGSQRSTLSTVVHQPKKEHARRITSKKNKPYILLMAEMRRSPVEVGSLNPSIDKVLYITGAKKKCKTLDAFHIFSLFSASVSFQKINRWFRLAWRTPLPRKDGVPAQNLASNPCSNNVNREECERDKTFVPMLPSASLFTLLGCPIEA